jgi:hypothetical protein
MPLPPSSEWRTFEHFWELLWVMYLFPYHITKNYFRWWHRTGSFRHVTNPRWKSYGLSAQKIFQRIGEFTNVKHFAQIFKQNFCANVKQAYLGPPPCRDFQVHVLVHAWNLSFLVGVFFWVSNQKWYNFNFLKFGIGTEEDLS